MQKFKAYLPLIAGIILIIATTMIFLPGVIWSDTILGVDIVVKYQGLPAVFGQASDPELKFNLGAFLGWLFILSAGIVSLIGALNKKLGILVLVGASIAIAGSVLVFLEAIFFNSANGFTDAAAFNLNVGPILGGIFGLIGAGAAGFAGVKALLSK